MSEPSNRLPVLANDIRRAHAGVREAAKVAASHAIAAGTALLEAKALLKHGEWLPWLKAHAGVSERTAQLYMKIVRLGLKSEMVADLGLQAAAKTVSVYRDPEYDPFHGASDAEVHEWLAFRLFIGRFVRPDHADHHVEWLLQAKKTYPLADWLSGKGDRWRQLQGYRAAKVGPRFLSEWEQFKRESSQKSRADLEREIDRQTEGFLVGEAVRS
ncbi:DUF3102 domain-containing protein [Bradyrhizobium sp. TM233]|uniref:DUF3102 domain-containing protein n=1 Tax=Bradyrhizobium sp. TM233 TaxID=2599801 RepID=UPI0027D5A5FC|nr:hypothetical protein TM233_58950 [Bradyrhizobium sp. TM233]